MTSRVTIFALVGVATAALPARAQTPRQILDRFVELDVWGMKGASLEGTALLKDKKGRERSLAFASISRRHTGNLSKSLVRFTAPPELAGAKFLQIQNDASDDDRYLYLPELRAPRRVAAGQRSAAFMGTDFSFADIDQRDYRHGQVVGGTDTKIGKYDCYHLVVTPGRSDSPYAKIELDLRKDSFIPLSVKLYDKADVHFKTMTVSQVRRVSGRWFVTRALMVNHQEQHSTLLTLTKIAVPENVPDQLFTQQNLKK